MRKPLELAPELLLAGLHCQTTENTLEMRIEISSLFRELTRFMSPDVLSDSNYGLLAAKVEELLNQLPDREEYRHVSFKKITQIQRSSNSTEYNQEQDRTINRIRAQQVEISRRQGEASKRLSELKGYASSDPVVEAEIGSLALELKRLGGARTTLAIGLTIIRYFGLDAFLAEEERLRLSDPRHSSSPLLNSP